MPSLLVVCTANVCRSLYAGVLFGSRLADAGSAWSVSTAGTDRASGRTSCELAVQRLAGDGVPDPGHRSRALSRADVSEADLILTAARDHRRFVVELDPRASARTFTLLEAVQLSRLTGGPDRRDGREQTLAARWHAARPQLPQDSGTSWFRRRSGARRLGIDIADGHNIGPRPHAETLDVVWDAVAELSAVLLSGTAALRPGSAENR